MRFRFFAFRCSFTALDSPYFPAGAAGDAFRGAFGHIFRNKLAGCAIDETRIGWHTAGNFD